MPMHLEVCVPEHEMPETPCPWFRVTVDGVTYQGQATLPPRSTGDGGVVYSVDMEPATEGCS
jgi:hypothetical protein